MWRSRWILGSWCGPKNPRRTPWVWRRRACLALFSCIALLFSACQNCGGKREPPGAGSAGAAQPALPAVPGNLILDLLIPEPQHLWESFRSGLGDSGRFLPSKYPVLVADALSASPVLSGRFLPELPVVGALSAGETQLQWVLGFRVQSGAELVAELTTGGNAAFRARELNSVVLLERNGPRSFGVANNMLLIGSDSAALEQLGAYVSRRDLAAPTTKAQIHLRLSPTGGTVFTGWAEKESGNWLSLLQGLLKEQRRDQAGLALGQPEKLFAKLEAERGRFLRALKGATGGQLELFVDGGPANSRLRVSGELEIPFDSRALTIPCEALPQVPQKTTGYLLFDPALLQSEATVAKEPIDPSWSSLFLPEQASAEERAAFEKLWVPWSGPLLLGNSNSSLFFSTGWDSDMSALEALVRGTLTLPLLSRTLPSVFSSEKSWSTRREGPLVVWSLPDTPSELAVGLSGGRGWFVSGEGAPEWLGALLSPDSNAASPVRSIGQLTCQRDLLVAAGVTTENGEAQLQLSRKDHSVTLVFGVPWVDFVQSVKAAIGGEP